MKLGAFDLAAVTQTLVYTAPADKRVTCTARFCNRGAATIPVRLALCAPATTPTAADWLLYEAPVPGQGLRDDTSVVVEAGERLYAQAAAVGVNIVLWGVVETV